MDIAQRGPVSLTPSQSYTLRCTITPPDTFDRWDNPALKTSIQNDSNLAYETDGNQYDLKISSMNFFLAGVWACYSKEGNSDNVTIHIARKYLSREFVALYILLNENARCISKE